LLLKFFFLKNSNPKLPEKILLTNANTIKKNPLKTFTNLIFQNKNFAIILMKTQNTHQTIPPHSTNSNDLVIFQTIPNPRSSFKMKPIFQRRATFRCSIPSNLTYLTKYRPKMLSTIELISLQSNQPNFKSIRMICQALEDTKRASSLIIRKDESHAQSLKQLKHLFNKTHHLHWKKLVVCYMNSAGEEHPSEKYFAEIATRLRRYRDLSYLDVYVCCSEDLKNHMLSHLFQQIKGLKNLHAFNLDLRGCQNREKLLEDYEPNALIFTFKFPRSLKCLSLSLGKTNFPNQKMLSRFASNLSHCSFLTYLDLYCGLNNAKPLEIQILAPIFKRVQSLKSFKIDQLFPPRLQLQDGLNSAKSLEYMRDLTQLELFIFFSLSEAASAVFAKTLLKHLASLTNLRSLNLTLVVTKFSSNDDGTEEQNIFLPLQSLINLQTLHLCLQCDEDNELPGLQSLSQALQSLPSIEDFGLFFFQNKVLHSHIISLSHMLKNLTSLRALTLVFHDADLESNSLELLSTGISRKLCLFLFDIRQKSSDLQRNEAFLWKHQKGLTSFLSTLHGFTSLFALDLDLSAFGILTKELRSLSLSLREMKQLCCLSLQFPKFPPDRKFQGLQNLLSSIKKMSNLNLLRLIFKGDQLCDEEVELIASSLTSHSKSLKTFELTFNETRELRNKSLLALQNGLRSLLRLRTLTLVFGPESVFNRETVNGLFEVLSFLKNLEAVIIQLPSEVVPLDFEGIFRKLAGHWNLKAFTVNKNSCLRNVNQNQH